MKKKTFNIGSKSMQVGRLSVRQVTSLMDAMYDRERVRLKADLDDAGVDTKLKLEKLQELREECMLTGTLLKSCFTLSGAMEVIAYAFDNEPPADFDNCDSDMVTNVAAFLIGFDLDELQESSAEGKDQTTVHADKRSPESG